MNDVNGEYSKVFGVLSVDEYVWMPAWVIDISVVEDGAVNVGEVSVGFVEFSESVDNVSFDVLEIELSVGEVAGGRVVG